MKTLSLNGMNDSKSTHRKNFLNLKDSTRDTWFNKRRYN